MWIGMAAKEAGVGLAETTVLYVLSTLSQTCAALVGFLGAIAVFRLQSLTSRRDEALARVRTLMEQGSGLVGVWEWTGRQLIDKADAFLQDAQGQPSLQRSLKLELRNLRRRDSEIPTAQRLLRWFVFVNVAVMVSAILSFLMVEFWASHPSWGGLFLTMSVVLVGYFTIAMAFEMAGAFTSKLDRVSWLRDWLAGKSSKGKG